MTTTNLTATVTIREGANSPGTVYTETGSPAEITDFARGLLGGLRPDGSLIVSTDPDDLNSEHSWTGHEHGKGYIDGSHSAARYTTRTAWLAALESRLARN